MSQTEHYDDLKSTIGDIYKSNPKPQFSVHVTGGGVQAIQWLFTVPGASACVLDAQVPYARTALSSFLTEHSCVLNDVTDVNANRNNIDTSCSAAVALSMAKASYRKSCALFLAENSHCALDAVQNVSSVFGVSCTAALVSQTVKKGTHRCHIATYKSTSAAVYSLEFTKGLRDRVEEDAECSRLLLHAIHVAANTANAAANTYEMSSMPSVLSFPYNQLENQVSPPSLPRDRHAEKKTKTEAGEAISDTTRTQCTPAATTEVVQVTNIFHNDVLENIYARKTDHALFFKKVTKDSNDNNSSSSDGGGGGGGGGGDARDYATDSWIYFENVTLPEGTLVYPGSFNPLHEGHLALVRAEMVRLRMQHEKQYHHHHHLEEHEHGQGTGGGGEESSGGGTPTVQAPPFVPPLVVFEIAAVNADKPPLPREEVLRRLEQFNMQSQRSRALFESAGVTNFAVSVTSAPLFAEKSRIFAGCTFLIGADTMTRLINTKYYRDKKEVVSSSSNKKNTNTNTTPMMESALDQQQQQRQQQQDDEKALLNMIAALTNIGSNGCKFVVGGRVTSTSSATSISGTATTSRCSFFETFDTIIRQPSAYFTSSSSSSSSSSSNTATTANISASTGTGASNAADAAAASHASTAAYMYPRVMDTLPRAVLDIFTGLTETEFRLDLSSTELRNRMASMK